MAFAPRWSPAMIRALSEELKPLAHDPVNVFAQTNSDLCNILKSTGFPSMADGRFYLVANCQPRHALRERRPFRNRAPSHRSEKRVETLSNALASEASPRSVCSMTRRMKAPKSTSRRRFRDAFHRRRLRSAGQRRIIFATAAHPRCRKFDRKIFRPAFRRVASGDLRLFRDHRIWRRCLPARMEFAGKPEKKS